MNKSFDDITLDLYRKLFRITTRAFYDPVGIVIIDYMVTKNRGSMTEDEIEQKLKIPKKRTRESFNKMKIDEIIKNDFEETRWTLNSNIREIIMSRIEHINHYIKTQTQHKETPKYKCIQCGIEIDYMLMPLYNGKCKECKIDFEKIEGEKNHNEGKIAEAINKIKSILKQLENREFDSRIYGEEYLNYLQKMLEKKMPDNNKYPGYIKRTGNKLSIHADVEIKNESHIRTFKEEPLYVKVLSKLKEKYKNLNINDDIIKNLNDLKTRYANNPSDIYKPKKTIDLLLKKRKIMASLTDAEYAKEYKYSIAKKIHIQTSLIIDNHDLNQDYQKKNKLIIIHMYPFYIVFTMLLLGKILCVVQFLNLAL